MQTCGDILISEILYYYHNMENYIMIINISIILHITTVNLRHCCLYNQRFISNPRIIKKTIVVLVKLCKYKFNKNYPGPTVLVIEQKVMLLCVLLHNRVDILYQESINAIKQHQDGHRPDKQ